MRLLKKDIKGLIPKEYYDCSGVGGLSISYGSYFLSFIDKNTYLLGTAIDSPVLPILKNKFKVTHMGHMWFHYHRFKITFKEN